MHPSIHNVTDILGQSLTDVLAITETKLDESYPKGQFVMEGYKTIRRDYREKSGGIMVLVRNDVPHKRRPELEHVIEHVQSLVVELIIRGQKCFFFFHCIL